MEQLSRITPMQMVHPRALLHFDKNRASARQLADKLSALAAKESEANCIFAIGGDGSLLYAIRELGHLNLPFIGIAGGTANCLMNSAGTVDEALALCADLVAYRLSRLRVQAIDMTHDRQEQLVFNDVGIRRQRQCTRISISVNGELEEPMLIGDGALMSTPQGSTGYAINICGQWLPPDSENYILAGMAVRRDKFELPWSYRTLESSDEVLMTALLPEVRPVVAFGDGISFGPVRSLLIARCPKSDVTVCFAPDKEIGKRVQRRRR